MQNKKGHEAQLVEHSNKICDTKTCFVAPEFNMKMAGLIMIKNFFNILESNFATLLQCCRAAYFVTANIVAELYTYPSYIMQPTMIDGKPI